MAAFLDRTGMRYNKLTVLKHAGTVTVKRHQWLCMCECGKEKVVTGGNLTSGQTMSCGCSRSAPRPKTSTSMTGNTNISGFVYADRVVRKRAASLKRVCKQRITPCQVVT